MPLSAATHTPVPAAESRPHPCMMESLPNDALCAIYPVWENRERKAGRKIGLKIVILPASGQQKAPDPLFVFAGGPGQPASDMVRGWASLQPLQPLRARRDIVFIDQRGTGDSNPLYCDFYGNPPDLQMVVSYTFPLGPVRVCRKRLEKVADLRRYTTSESVDDVDEVRRWLGYGKINIFGGSYASLVAQVYLRRHGANVRSAVLTGVVPPDELIPLHYASTSQRALDILLNKCRADRECNAAYPELPREFHSVFERVQQGVEVDVHDSRGRTSRVRPTVYGLGEGFLHYLYSNDSSSVPAMIHHAAKEDLTPLLQTFVTAQIHAITSLAMGMNLSVTCSETIPYIDDAALARETAHTFLGDLRVKEQRAACKEWVRGPVPKDVHELVRSDVPVLLISGAHDPVTPPEFAERAVKGLPNSRLLVFPESGHGNLNACGIRIVIDFLEHGSAQGLDVACVSKQEARKFVVPSAAMPSLPLPRDLPPSFSEAPSRISAR